MHIKEYQNSGRKAKGIKRNVVKRLNSEFLVQMNRPSAPFIEIRSILIESPQHFSIYVVRKACVSLKINGFFYRIVFARFPLATHRSSILRIPTRQATATLWTRMRRRKGETLLPGMKAMSTILLCVIKRSSFYINATPQ